MKKIVLLLFMCLLSQNASAQMSDAMGTLLIDGELSTQGYQALGQGQNAMKRMRFQQDLGNLVAEIQTTYFGNYAGLSKESLGFSGFPDINWNVGADNAGGFYVMFSGLSGNYCFLCQNGTGARRVEINGSGSCQAQGNQVKLFF